MLFESCESFLHMLFHESLLIPHDIGMCVWLWKRKEMTKGDREVTLMNLKRRGREGRRGKRRGREATDVQQPASTAGAGLLIVRNRDARTLSLASPCVHRILSFNMCVRVPITAFIHRCISQSRDQPTTHAEQWTLLPLRRSHRQTRES